MPPGVHMIPNMMSCSCFVMVSKIKVLLKLQRVLLLPPPPYHHPSPPTCGMYPMILEKLSSQCDRCGRSSRLSGSQVALLPRCTATTATPHPTTHQLQPARFLVAGSAASPLRGSGATPSRTPPKNSPSSRGGKVSHALEPPLEVPGRSCPTTGHSRCYSQAEAKR